jgi:fucose 4-O-acetylase-like acetyltransferase
MSLKLAAYIIYYFSAAMCFLTVSFLLIKVNKRIPGSFALNICLYTVAILSRAITLSLIELEQEKERAIMSSCVSLIELSLAYFIFQINAFKIKLREDYLDELNKKLKLN